MQRILKYASVYFIVLLHVPVVFQFESLGLSLFRCIRTGFSKSGTEELLEIFSEVEVAPGFTKLSDSGPTVSISHIT